MVILSNFDETLKDLLFDKKITVEQFANDAEITLSEAYRYLRKESVPKLSTIIKIADAYNYSIDFLVGITPFPDNITFKRTPLFSQQFKELLSNNTVSRYRLSKDLNISINRIDDWYHGKCLPSAENAIKLAEFFKCTLDSLLGREN